MFSWCLLAYNVADKS